MAEVDSFEVIVAGTSEMAEDLLLLFIDEFKPSGEPVRLIKAHGDFGDALDLKSSRTNETIARFKCISLANGRVLVKSILRGTIAQDPTGSRQQEFVEFLINRLEQYGLMAKRAKFVSVRLLETAVRQLASADSAAAFAAVGTTCRLALIQLAREVYIEEMRGEEDSIPKGDDAKTKLRAAAKFYWGGHGSNQLNGVIRMVEGAWDIAAASVHRPESSREEAEIVLISARAVFDSFAFLVP